MTTSGGTGEEGDVEAWKRKPEGQRARNLEMRLSRGCILNSGPWIPQSGDPGLGSRIRDRDTTATATVPATGSSILPDDYDASERHLTYGLLPVTSPVSLSRLYTGMPVRDRSRSHGSYITALRYGGPAAGGNEEPCDVEA
eukprot:3436454-Rhodomonas_salina.1